ncbi:hypothetical protein THAOC_19797 [Thalassiosira oceanica]|uniref:Uncharacterized protein n=2 Tax=Thalassiosira oceanica TaxID=159749 RepID=K0SG44_THAOC|nr:hypothetical protein THAOC_19797 [Thalassiosira oceanica]|eukprot:EJK59926.1 hypothetical protein THAOC_19797 [Thalassiosira oceanica]
MESYPAELRFLRLTASARPRAGGGDCAWVSQSLRSRKGHRNTPFQPIGSPYHTMEGQGKTAKTYARRAQEICAVRAVVEATTATTRDREAVASRQSPSSVVFADRSAHRFPESEAGAGSRLSRGRGDAQRGAYRREGDGAHRRGGRGRGSHYASSLLHFHDDETG